MGPSGRIPIKPVSTVHHRLVRCSLGTLVIVLDHETSSQIEQGSGTLIGNGLSGLIGIGTNRATPDNTSGFSANFGDSIMGQIFMHYPGAVNFTFGVMLNKPLTTPRGNSTASTPVSGAGSSAGVVHWLRPDASAYDSSKLSWATATGGLTEYFPTISSNVTGAGDWMLNMDGWVLSSSSNHVSSSNSIFATVDMLYSELYLPADQAKLILIAQIFNKTSILDDVIPDAELRTDLSSLGTLSEAWSIPCNSSLTFGLTVNSQNFIMDQNVLVVELPDGSCVSAIEGWTDPTVTTYLFGSRFISTIYLYVPFITRGPAVS
ncbi:hypothetical protein EIP86_002438 [Pleurotus ostreatoroseus]|nr:hypothetical protein EIP86_002438 [Pleurotus ostreatoroseus]